MLFFTTIYYESIEVKRLLMIHRSDTHKAAVQVVLWEQKLSCEVVKVLLMKARRKERIGDSLV